MELQRFGRNLMQSPGARQALFDHATEVDRRYVELAAGSANAARPQDLLYGPQQPVAFVQHDFVELFALRVVDGACLQSLEVKPDGRHGSLQLVGDRIDKSIVLLIAPDLPHEKNCVQYDAADDHRQQQHTEEEQDSAAPVEQDPTDVEEENDQDQASAERYEKRDRLLPPCQDHDFSLCPSGPRMHGRQEGGGQRLARVQPITRLCGRLTRL